MDKKGTVSNWKSRIIKFDYQYITISDYTKNEKRGKMRCNATNSCFLTVEKKLDR